MGESTVTGKEPWLAVNLSRIFPGLGQLYAGDRRKGSILLAVSIFLMLFALWSWVADSGNPIVGFVCVLLVSIVQVWNWFDAYFSAKRRNEPAFEQARKSSKDGWLAFLLSTLIPGLGQFYLKKVLFGLLWLIGTIALSLILPNSLAPLFILLNIASGYHAYFMAPRRSGANRMVPLLCGLLVLTSLMGPYGLRSFVEARYIPSQSMAPTLQPGDRLVVNKVSYRFNNPQRGDIVIFNRPEQLKEKSIGSAFVMRIIGLPEETVEVKDGKVWINNQPLTESYITSPPEYAWGPETVPTKAYFVLGDSRNNSYDSHFWGYVPHQNILGKVTKIFYPIERIRSF